MSRFLRVVHHPVRRAQLAYRWLSAGGPSDTYNSLVSNGSIIADKVQLIAITQLQQLYEKILEYKAVGAIDHLLTYLLICLVTHFYMLIIYLLNYWLVSVIDEPVKVEAAKSSSSSSGWFSSGFGRNSSNNNEKIEKNGTHLLAYYFTHSLTQNHSKIT